MPVLPTIPTFTDGPSSSSQMTQLTDALRFLYRRPIAKLRQTVAQTLTTSVITAITFTTEDVDTDVDNASAHDTSSNTSRYTARYPGWYAAGGRVSFAAGATGRRMTSWQVNGVEVNGARYFVAASSSIITPAMFITTYLAQGDYLELLGYHEQGVNLNTEVGAAAEQSIANIWWIGSTS